MRLCRAASDLASAGQRANDRFWPGTASRPRAAGHATSAPVRAIARQLFVRFFRLHLFALRVQHLRECVGMATARNLGSHELQRPEAATAASKSEGNLGTGTTPVHDAVCAAKALVRGNEASICADACNNDSVRNGAHRAWSEVRLSAIRTGIPDVGNWPESVPFTDKGTPSVSLSSTPTCCRRVANHFRKTK